MSEYDNMTDDRVVEAARLIYRELQRTPGWHDNNDALIKSWREVLQEVHRRGITDTVTEGQTSGERFTRLMNGDVAR